ncbi:hypothetical protein PR202_gb08078 [Eleusine coracana subsp. coracana]|uniref:NADP-dependent oxidoreductase domain-containing protein n=1 Tax=Eleusine coracana subsp. coracana TaxID=191504 RepID=A0AAV5EDE6_ELECO|nr:hypothetical protein PR202_gb08078 [Eleusine coracana subsp. coracana]
MEVFSHLSGLDTSERTAKQSMHFFLSEKEIVNTVPVPPPLLAFPLRESKMEQREMPRLKLGSQGLEVSKLGFGCMGLTGVYNGPVPEEAGITIIKHAFEAGITFFDTADAYGPHTNEVLLGKALKQLPREKVQVATKCGIERFDAGGLRVKGTPDYVRASCEASLQRLDVDYIDLYYQHRIDQSIPIEETVCIY